MTRPPDAIAARADKPTVRLAAGELQENVAAAIAALKIAGVKVFNRGGRLVRPVRVTETEMVGGCLKRVEGAVDLRPVSTAWLVLRLAGAAEWLKWHGRSETWRKCDPPAAIARAIIAVPEEGGWPSASRAAGR